MTISTLGVNDSPEGNSGVSGSEEGDVTTEEVTSDSEPEFPHAKLAELDSKISSPRWVVPVLPEQELECLLQASIDLSRKGTIYIVFLFFNKFLKRVHLLFI